MKELECPAAWGKGFSTGTKVTYRFKGKTMILCETLHKHYHCDCGEPTSKPEPCKYCKLEKNKIRYHNTPAWRESRTRTDLRQITGEQRDEPILDQSL